MSDDHKQEVDEILHSADESIYSLLESGDSESMLETAQRASAFLESTEPDGVLEAVGLETRPDASEAEAIAQAEEAHLEKLQRLLSLSNLADSDEDSLTATAITVRESTETVPTADDERTDPQPGSEVGKPDEDDEHEKATDQAREQSDQGVADAITDTVTDAATDDAEAGKETLESAIQSSVAAFGDDIERLRGRLEEAVSDQSGEKDEGLLEAEFGGEGRESTSKGVVRHSTMPPPPSDRADMRGTARHSTMPDK